MNLQLQLTPFLESELTLLAHLKEPLGNIYSPLGPLATPGTAEFTASTTNDRTGVKSVS